MPTIAPQLVTFHIREPYHRALPVMRRAIIRSGLLVQAELDVASRIRRALGAIVGPCTVLFVDDPALLLEGIVFHPAVALGIPQPLVVSGRDRYTELHIRSPKAQVDGGFPASVHNPLVILQERIVGAIETPVSIPECNFAADSRGRVYDCSYLSGG